MAGPWFTVTRDGDTWQETSQLWISNGTDDCRGTVQIRVWLDDGQPAPSVASALAPADLPTFAHTIVSKELHHE